jgi:hypothetical protein
MRVLETEHSKDINQITGLFYYFKHFYNKGTAFSWSHITARQKTRHKLDYVEEGKVSFGGGCQRAGFAVNCR